MPIGESRPSARRSQVRRDAPIEVRLLAFALLLAIASGCAKTLTSGTNASSPSAPCPTLTGSPWVPNVPGSGASNHGTNVTETRATVATSGTIVGLSQTGTSAQEISVSIDMTSDLGPGGSLTLIGQVTGFPASLSGNAIPMLVSLVDSNSKEWVNLARGAGSACDTGGYFTCDASGNCSGNPSCKVSWPSAFADTTHWQQHQITNLSSAVGGLSWPSVNTFPTCNWSQGSAAPSTDTACAFNSSYFVSGKLPIGTYQAKYLLMASGYTSVPGGYTAGLSVTAVKKTNSTNPNTTVGGALDVNVILVGSKNIQASRTAKGQQNLNTLFTEVYGYYNQANTNIKLGTISAYEWTCDLGGDNYATLNTDNLGGMLKTGSAMMPSSTAGRAVNLFFISSFTDSSLGNLQILGISGGIGGPSLNGTPTSGVSFASFNMLDQYNSGCNGAGVCPLSSQDMSFVDLGQTIAHEMGHYLGLNHPSESDGAHHDVVYDTPICTAQGSLGYINGTSCRVNDANVYTPTGKTCNTACPGYDYTAGVYCPAAVECQFNHVMWWTNKHFTAGTTSGDGCIFSPDTSQILNYSPLVQ